MCACSIVASVKLTIDELSCSVVACLVGGLIDYWPYTEMALAGTDFWLINGQVVW